MSTASYRVATTEDVDAIVTLVEAAYRSESSLACWTSEAGLVAGARTSVAEINDAVQDRDSCMLVGEIDDMIVSCCRLSVGEANTVHFGMFCVHPLRQSHGLGGELLDRAMVEAAQRFGAMTIALYVVAQREELRRWYERLGFVATGERLTFSSVADPTLALIPGLEFVVYERTINR